ncbi:SusC/RagA family TonB-linked outer membrane protein [Solitalea canadensis]|uniref:TonB-linked outer membrane protein, SusC/RagA family n=1 Tax=Solitalea canadensis (strain ATCC 29591 / DSM 3403 / JCM 21819 / LMG 8368 / NBRC 15130 / NCIMB 12057 / USAM 9D) TaxID=929556 RepID=H8KV96_SOLCM|nr:TonB-dependent receptor [Solitalea canadensis]AFD06154.1 TonB-linked outer membrane protein, SusC/RagA family [Solitalea canadensis DSM 3403]
MNKRLLLFLLSFVFFSVQALAQKKTITGKVTSAEDGTSLTGVSVVIKNTNAGISTDVDGNYSIKAEKGQILIFSYYGAITQEKIIGTENVINVKMVSDTKVLDEVVVVGYGTQKKANLTGAVATIDPKMLESRPITDVARGLQGAVPGLTITTATGDLGTNPSIKLRGLVGSVNMGTTGPQPLILVDNVEIPNLSLINPEDIATLSVLKDAASTSIYGARGAWGVILITTKSGKKGSPSRITYSNNVAWATPTKTPTMASAADNAQASFTAFQRVNPDTKSFGVIGYTIDEASIAKMREWDAQYKGQNLGDEMVMGRDFDIINEKLFFYRSWDAGNMYMRDWTPTQKHDLNISGGSENTSYNIGLGYLGQEGVLKVNPDSYNRYNMSVGVNTTVNKWLDARGKIMFTNAKTSTPFSYSSTAYGPWYYLYRWPANYPYGTYEGKPFRGTIAEVSQADMDVTKDVLSRISIGGTLKPVKDLTIDMDYTYTNTNMNLHQVGKPTYAYDFWSFNGKALDYKNYQSVSYDKVREYEYLTENNTGKIYATYNYKLTKDHVFKGMLGSDIEKFVSKDMSANRRNMLHPDYGSIPLTTGDQSVEEYSSWRNSEWTTIGFFGRINYAYKDKYLLEVNGRYDGSSRFPVNDLWAFFPSTSVGYVISQEPFMESAQSVVSFLKVRGSYGSVGNQSVGAYRFLRALRPKTTTWITNGNNVPTVYAPNNVSPTLSWETVTTLDIGVDARFLNDKLGFTFDWYQRTTSDMVTMGATLPATYGADVASRNFGELQGRGWEFAVDFNHTFENGLRLTAQATLADGQERITKFANLNKTLPNAMGSYAINANTGTSYYEGMKVGEIWGYETERYFTVDDFKGQDAGGKWIYKEGVPKQDVLQSGNFYYGPGDIKYKDLNGDGVINFGGNTLDDHGDKKVIGNSTPRYQYGLKLGAAWKGFDLDVYFQGVGKRDLWASGNIVVPGFRAGEGWYDYQMDYWTPENQDAYYPRPIDYGSAGNKWNFEPQTKYLLDMSYLRMKNLTLGYTLDQKFAERVKVQKVRFYLTGENLLTFDNLNVPIDPEIDFSTGQLGDSSGAGFGRSYPYRKTISVGLQVTF